MKLPKNLSNRYTQMSPDEMEGSGQAKDLISAAMLKRGGSPGPVKMADEKISKAILRPGVISWDANKDSGVWFDIKKPSDGPVVPSAKGLQIGKVLSSRYVQAAVGQGQDVLEFPKKGPETPVTKAKAKMVESVKQKAEAKMEAVKEAAAVEVKAKALAEKAKATKEAALAGLAGLGYFGDAQARVAAANEKFAKAQAAAFAIGGCQPMGTPNFVCNPQLMTDFTNAQKELAEAAKEAGDQEAMKVALEAEKKIASAQGKKIKMLMGVIAVLVLGIGAYFFFNREG